MNEVQAVSVIYNAAQLARLNAQEHAQVNEAMMVLKSFLEKEEGKIKDKTPKDEK